MKATLFSSSISENLGNFGEAKFTSIWLRNLWPPHFRTFCELVEGEENKLANLGNSGEAMVEIHKYSVKQ